MSAETLSVFEVVDDTVTEKSELTVLDEVATGEKVRLGVAVPLDTVKMDDLV